MKETCTHCGIVVLRNELISFHEGLYCRECTIKILNRDRNGDDHIDLYYDCYKCWNEEGVETADLVDRLIKKQKNEKRNKVHR